MASSELDVEIGDKVSFQFSKATEKRAHPSFGSPGSLGKTRLWRVGSRPWHFRGDSRGVLENSSSGRQGSVRRFIFAKTPHSGETDQSYCTR